MLPASNKELSKIAKPTNTAVHTLASMEVFHKNKLNSWLSGWENNWRSIELTCLMPSKNTSVYDSRLLSQRSWDSLDPRASGLLGQSL